MDFTDAIAAGFRNYVNFRGRASRSEYWYWTLFVILLSIAASIIDAIFFSGIEIAPNAQLSPLNTLVALGVLLPGLAVSVRRLHDLDRTGWWLLILLTVIGGILLLVWFCMRGTSGDNHYGVDPLGNPA
jgi:uncharacterized membrane protein YhaH (DUF805 family)